LNSDLEVPRAEVPSGQRVKDSYTDAIANEGRRQ